MLTAARLSYLLRQTHVAISQQLSEVVQEFGLTPSQYTVLSIVKEHPEGISSAALARRLGVAPQSSNEIVGSLERMELIRRAEESGYRRVLLVCLTAKGAVSLNKCDKQVDRFEQKFYGGLSTSEQTQLRKMLVTVIRDNREKIAADSLGAVGARPA
jgi:DNA-binding MarR family transcriptional regulator